MVLCKHRTEAACFPEFLECVVCNVQNGSIGKTDGAVEY